MKLNTKGFAHFIVIAVVAVATMSLVGYAGYNISKNAFSDENDGTEPQTSEVATLRLQAVGDSLVAGEEYDQTDADNIRTKDYNYNISTPEGSLNHTIRLLQDGDFGSALFFVSPRFMFRGADALGVDYTNLKDGCNNNRLCTLGLSVPVDDIPSGTMNISSHGGPTGGRSAYSFNLAFKLENGRLVTDNARYGGYSTQIEMYEAGDRWILDKLVVQGYEI